MLFHHKSNIIENPPIAILKRKKLADEQSVDFNGPTTQLESVAFVLKRSGKVIRKVESSPPVNLRNWKPISLPNNNEAEPTPEQALIRRQMIAETIYVLKPIAHLLSIFRFGNNTWKPWALSLLIDLASLHLHNTNEHGVKNVLSAKQQLQLSRRYFALLLYLLRSPFYDKYSKRRLHNFLIGCGQKVPLAHLICMPLAQYIPHWQKTYFYMWST